VAEIVYSTRAVDQIERALAKLMDVNPVAADAAKIAIRSAIETLASHPLVGRRIQGDVRELVISYGASGYIALYRFAVRQGQVQVLALRHQREIGYLP
jgi:plasmid stabilization system protein ParE